MNASSSHSHELFTRLLVSNQRRIYGLIFTLVQDHNVADDILQDATTLLWQKFESFEIGTDFGAWAMRVARFKVLEWRRGQHRLPLPIEDELLQELAGKAEAAQLDSDVGREDALEHCLNKLSERDQSLLDERYRQQKSVSRMAELRDRTRDAIYKVLARIHRDLQDCVQGQLREIQELP